MRSVPSEATGAVNPDVLLRLSRLNCMSTQRRPTLVGNLSIYILGKNTGALNPSVHIGHVLGAFSITLCSWSICFSLAWVDSSSSASCHGRQSFRPSHTASFASSMA